ncbi:hypothetical protein GCM10010319_46140 [Streptomyces blastmyceticus]|uniref:Uncharacterized protein n=1 Tax=Streptomyces blastmyceticus TaxID=68180 RepID=A0ABN0XFX9_9ACTN
MSWRGSPATAIPHGKLESGRCPLTPEVPRRTGSWAALHINADTMQVSSLTVRPHKYVPSHLSLDELGQVYTINFG